MKRQTPILLVLAASVAALAGGILLLRPRPAVAPAANAFTTTGALSSRAVEAALEAETTIRNVTEKAVTYQVRFFGSTEWRPDTVLPPGAIDRVRTRLSLEIRFNNGLEDLTYTLEAGSPYSFRYDEDDRLQIFLGSHGRADAVDLAPYVPTPAFVVDKMLRTAGVAAADVVYDIGCGDGRIVIAAAKAYGARGVGIDLDEKMIRECDANARAEGVAGRVKFLRMDATKADLREATVVATYLLPESNALMRPVFEAQLRPGTRIVTHNYPVPGWTETKKLTVTDGDGKEHLVFLYVR